MTLDQWLAEVARRIKISEGCRLTAYPDPLSGGDPWTIGFGATGPDIKMGTTWTQAQADAALISSIPKYVAQARVSLAGLGAQLPFDSLSDARRFVVTDLVYNMGLGGWMAFTTTRTLIVQGQMNKDKGNMDRAHALFLEAGDHLTATPWCSQTGDRAKRDIAMMRSGVWVSATGDGTS